MNINRNEWPLWAQAKHATRYPWMWTTQELYLLVAATKEETKDD